MVGSLELWQKQLEATPFGAVVQAVSGLRVDGRGRIWVGVPALDGGLERIDILDMQGRLVGRIARPHVVPAVIHGDGLEAFVQRDNSDAQQLVIMRVVE